MISIKKIITILLLLSVTWCATGQSIVGSASAYVGDTKTYTFDTPTVLTNPKWTTPGGTSKTIRYTTNPAYRVNATFTTVGNFTIIFQADDEDFYFTKTVSVTAAPPPCTVATPARANVSRCGSGVVTLSATPGTNGNSIRWYDGSNVLLATGTSYSPTISSTTTYYLSSFNTANPTCESSKVSVTATVLIRPGIPRGSTGTSRCGPGSVILTSTPVPVLEGQTPPGPRWYDAITGGTLLDEGEDYQTPILSATTNYYVSSYDISTGCESDRRLNVATINPIPASPTVSGNQIFGPGKFSLTASGPSGSSYKWYSTATGGSPVSNANPYVSPTDVLVSTNNYIYASTYSSNCESARTAVNVTVIPLPVVTASSWYASKEPVVLNSSSGYDSYSWTGATTATTQSIQTYLPGDYILTVTKNGLAYSLTATIKSQLQDINKNYVVTNTAMASGVTSASYSTSSIGTVNQSIQYVDGLGRPDELIVTMGSPLKNDIVQPTVYDLNGWENRRYLPFVAERSGRYKTVTFDASGNYAGIAADFYGANAVAGKIAQDSRPFSESLFEASPLDRPVKTYGEGIDWSLAASGGNNKYVQYQYLTNTHSTGTSLTAEKIIAWKLSAGLPVRDLSVNSGTGYYATGSLTVKVVTNEQGMQTREYVDSYGRVILKKVQVLVSVSSLNDDQQWALTYSIYDEIGNLRFVLQPELSRQLLSSDNYNPTQTDLNQRAFQYKYDGRHRIVEKQIPGVDVFYMVYDNRNRLVMTQDGNQRKNASGAAKAEWSFTKYDYLNRPVITGIYTHGTVVDQTAMSGLITTANETYNGVATTHGYTNTVFPTLNTQVLTVNYYDNYKFRDDLAGATNYNYNAGDLTNQEASANTAVRGFLTGIKVNILGTSTYLWGITYYDQRYRVIQTKNLNHKNGIDRVSNVYDFAKLMETKTVSMNGATSYSTQRKYTYDHTNRLKRVYHKIQNETSYVLLYENSYNELGQLIMEKVHSRDDGTSYAQSTDYLYNIRGWLRTINNPSVPEAGDLFSIELNYNKPTTNGGSAQYSGNISEIIWKSAGLDKQSYGYAYDAMDRLLEANYFNVTRPLNNGRYTEKIGDPTAIRPAYDLNGNILNLIRYGKSTATTFDKIDDLNYKSYNGNQVTKIEDSKADTGFDDGFKNATNVSNEYTYDWNGNMLIDQNKGITAITYNFLNLPVQVNKGSSNYVVYTYDATGRKLTQKVFGTTPKTTQYLGEFVYENTSGTDVLQFVNHEKGRIVPDASAGAIRPWEYQYFLKDHLGNVRVTFSEKKGIAEYRATFETGAMAQESGNLLGYSNLGSMNEYDHTDVPGTINTRSQLLNAGNGSQVGVAKSFIVNPGDVVDVEVYAKHEQQSSSNANPNTLLNALVGVFSLGTGSTVLESAQAQNAFTGVFSGGGPWITNTKWESSTAPKAYLNYILFDQSFNLIDFGFDQVSEAAMQVGVTPFVAHDFLSLHVKVQQKGYLYIYVSNENPVQANVYFDDFKITYNTGVEQITDYYPFGLQITSTAFNKQGGTRNSFLFQSQELQDELNLVWYQFKWRNHDPAIGRFFNVDPLAEKYFYNSPYAFSENKVVAHRELEGLETGNANAIWNSQIYSSIGLNYRPNEVTTRDIGIDLTKKIAANCIVAASLFVPVEEFAVLGVGALATRFPAIGRLLGISQAANKIAKTEEIVAGAEESITLVKYNNGFRTPDGKFASPTSAAPSPGASAEEAVWDAVGNKPNWTVTEGRVYVKDANGNVRVYDGVAHSPSGNNIGLEVKSGTASKTPEQRTFDDNLNSSTENVATGTGRNTGLEVHRALEIRTK